LEIGAFCENQNNLMKICVNGLEIFMELSGNQMLDHAFIDILMKSPMNEIQTIQLVHDHVLSRIEHLLEPSMKYHSRRGRILTLCQNLRTKGQPQVNNFYGA
jgi:hypothetical protein